MKQSNVPFVVKIGVFIVVTVVIWLIFSIYNALVTPPDIQVPSDRLQNFDATFDEKALTELQESIYLSEEDVSQNIVVVEDEEIEEIVEAEEVEEELETEEPADEES